MQDEVAEEQVGAGVATSCVERSAATAEEGLRLLEAFRSIPCAETRARLLGFAVALANRFAVAGTG